jgi:hypothetical protein
MLGAVALHIGVRAAPPVELAEAEAVTTQPSA